MTLLFPIKKFKKEQQESDEKKQEGEISKEDAERILQLMQNQDKENMKDQKPAQIFKPEKDEKKVGENEDW